MNTRQVKRFCRTILHISDDPVKISGGTMYAVIVEISAKMASDWIEKANTRNRNCRQSRVRQFVSDMTEDRWMLTHQAIAFDVDGEIISGQHRLEAVVLSGVTIRQLVILNCSCEERATVDQTLSRNVRDVASLAYNDKISGRLTSLARSMAFGRSLRSSITMTPQAVYQFIETHRVALEFVLGCIKRPVSGVTTATVLGPIGRAFYSTKQKDLKQFLSVLCEGFSLNDRDKPTILLRNWLLEHRDGIKNFKGRQRAYDRTSAALMAFKNFEEPVRLYKPKDELFNLPEVG